MNNNFNYALGNEDEDCKYRSTENNIILTCQVTVTLTRQDCWVYYNKYQIKVDYKSYFSQGWSQLFEKGVQICGKGKLALRMSVLKAGKNKTAWIVCFCVP